MANSAGAEKETAAAEHRDDFHDTDVAVQLAHDEDDTKYSPWTPRLLRLYGVLFFAYLCGCLNGFDGSLMGGLNGMRAYQRYFNMSGISALQRPCVHQGTVG